MPATVPRPEAVGAQRIWDFGGSAMIPGRASHFIGATWAPPGRSRRSFALLNGSDLGANWESVKFVLPSPARRLSSISEARRSRDLGGPDLGVIRAVLRHSVTRIKRRG